MANVTQLGDVCSLDADCADATAVHGAAECSHANECRCHVNNGFGGTECNSLTPSSFVPITVQTVLVLEYTFVLWLASRALGRVCNRGKRGFILTTTICTWLASLLAVMLQIESLVHLCTASYFVIHHFVRELLIAGVGVFVILAALNVSFMWIEVRVTCGLCEGPTAHSA